VHTTATTRRPPIPNAIFSTSCAASITITLDSSPTIHTLLSTAHVPPSSENIPDVRTWSIGSLVGG
jgi:hypothetical protein